VAAAGKPTFFSSPDRFDAWLAKNGGKRSEVRVGYWKVGTGKPTLTWAQSVEVALRHGWIDGVRHSLGPESYTIRFTPRRQGSKWSNVNLRIAERLLADGRMTAAGKAAYEARRKDQPPQGSYEQPRPVRFLPADARRIRQDPQAWAWLRSAPPSYRRACAWWLRSAKRPETRERRLARLIHHSAKGETMPEYRWSRGATTSKGAKSKSGAA
jgi:uncharacterized protein YdeI (YjbR/CyaY-like superfamily)